MAFSPRSTGALAARLRWRNLAAVAVACAVVAGGRPAGGSQDRQAAVLTIQSTRRDAPAAAAFDRAFERMVGEGLGGRLDYYTEFLDLARFDEPDYPAALRDFLRAKYKGHRFDLIVVTSNASAEFVKQYRDDLFPGTPVVSITGAGAAPGPNATGVIVGLDFSTTVHIAIRIQPDTRNVVVVSGASSWDKYYETAARSQFKDLEGQLAFTYLSGLPMRELLARVANLPAHSIVYYLTVVEDGVGQRFVALDSLDKVAAVANAPIYAWHTVGMDHGIVGGSLQSMDVLSTKIAEISLRVLRGERPEAIPVETVDANVSEFDWRQLQRWGISESRLPPGSVVRYRQPSPWEKYKVYIVAAFAVLLVQTILITALLVQRTRRVKTEQVLRQSEARYARATAAGAVGVWDWKLGTNDIFVDPQLKMLLGYEDWEIRNDLDDWGRRVHPDDSDAVMAGGQACIEGRSEVYEVEHRMLHKDGSVRWFLARGSVLRSKDGTPYRMVGTDSDITERKRAEREIYESEAALRASSQEIQNLAGRLIAAQEEERTRIARDLHDDVSQELAGLSITLSSLARRVSASASEDLQPALTSLQQRTIVVAEKIRHLSHDLHPGVLQHAGLVAALTSHCAEYQRRQTVEVILEAGDTFGSIDPESALCLYRVAQEALRNVFTHADARKVVVRLIRTDHHAELTVADDGKGFDPRHARGGSDGLGLVSINERVRLVGGTVEVLTQPTQGTTIQVRIPLEPDGAGDISGVSEPERASG